MFITNTPFRNTIVNINFVVFVFFFNFFFIEREENVKADIFAAYITLLRQTRPVASQTLDADAMEDDSGWGKIVEYNVKLTFLSIKFSFLFSAAFQRYCQTFTEV